MLAVLFHVSEVINITNNNNNNNNYVQCLCYDFRSESVTIVDRQFAVPKQCSIYHSSSQQQRCHSLLFTWWLPYSVCPATGRPTTAVIAAWSCNQPRTSLPAGSAAGSSAGVVFTHGPILRFFAPQGRRVAPIKVKFGREERTIGPLLPAKFVRDRLRGGGLRPPKLKKIEFYQYNCP